MTLPDDSEDPFEYIGSNLSEAHSLVDEVESDINVGPSLEELNRRKDDIHAASDQLESLSRTFDEVHTLMCGLEDLAIGADEAYERIHELRDFLNHVGDGVYAARKQSTIPAGEMTVDGVTYEVHLTPIEDDSSEDDE